MSHELHILDYGTMAVHGVPARAIREETEFGLWSEPMSRVGNTELKIQSSSHPSRELLWSDAICRHVLEAGLDFTKTFSQSEKWQNFAAKRET